MILHRRAAPIALALSMLAGGAFAAPTAYVFDKAHTEVRFCWNHFGVSHQCAHLTDYDGELLYDEANPQNSKLNITFKMDSIETLNPVFNGHLKSEKFFDTAKFPAATFKSTKVEKTGEKTGKVTGDLTIKGVTKPITLNVTLNFAGPHPLKKVPTLGFGATGTLKRADFGVSLYVPAVSDEISVEIQTETNQKG